jgi:hypothetical protein
MKNIKNILLLTDMVTPITLLCECNKCDMWRETQVHGGQIVRTKKQCEANPRLYACEHIAGDVHSKDTSLRPNKKVMLPGVGYGSEVYTPLSPMANQVNDAAPSRPSRACKRVAVLQYIDVECSNDK